MKQHFCAFHVVAEGDTFIRWILADCVPLFCCRTMETRCLRRIFIQWNDFGWFSRSSFFNFQFGGGYRLFMHTFIHATLHLFCSILVGIVHRVVCVCAFLYYNSVVSTKPYNWYGSVITWYIQNHLVRWGLR